MQVIFAIDIVGRILQKEREMSEQGSGRSGRPRGRPPLTAGEPKRGSFNSRLRIALKIQLQGAARAAGRSLSEEIEHRLEQSFHDDNAWGGTRTKALLQRLASMSRLHGPYSQDDDWLKEKLYFNQVLHEWRQYLDQMRLNFDDADREQRGEDIERFRNMIESASPEQAATLRRWAREKAEYTHLDPDERDQWALLGEDLGNALPAEKPEGRQ